MGLDARPSRQARFADAPLLSRRVLVGPRARIVVVTFPARVRRALHASSRVRLVVRTRIGARGAMRTTHLEIRR